MRIAGYVPSSLIDFPGRVSAVTFSPGCTLRCPFCHNAALVLQEENAEDKLAEFLGFLERRRGLLSGVAVSGGEACLQEGLAEFLRKIRAMGFHTKLDTNGTRPEVLAALLKEKLVDIIAMDIKAPRDLYEKLCGLSESALPWAKIQESIRFIAGAEKTHNNFNHIFRTTVMEPHFDEGAILRMRELAPGGLPWRLQPYEGRRGTLDANFTAHAPAQEKLAYWQKLIDER
jgi:pyruvate formate lyase activating enzyme